MGFVSFQNANRTIGYVAFTGGGDFGVGIVPPNITSYSVDAVVGLGMDVGPKPRPIVHVTWECHGKDVYGWGQGFCIAIGWPFHWKWIIPPKGATGRLSFGFPLEVTEEHYTWGIKVKVGDEEISKENIYSFTLKRANATATNTASNATSSSAWSWAGDSLAYYQTNPSYLQIEQESNETFNIDISNFIADDGNRTLYTYGEGTGAESFLKNPSIYTVEKLYR